MAVPVLGTGKAATVPGMMLTVSVPSVVLAKIVIYTENAGKTQSCI